MQRRFGLAARMRAGMSGESRNAVESIPSSTRHGAVGRSDSVVRQVESLTAAEQRVVQRMAGEHGATQSRTVQSGGQAAIRMVAVSLQSFKIVHASPYASPRAGRIASHEHVNALMKGSKC